MLHFFLWPNNIPLYGYITSYVFIHQLIDIWVVSTFWLLWTMSLWTFEYKFLCEHMFSFLLGIYLVMELLDHIVILCSTLWGTAKLFAKVCTICILLGTISGRWFYEFVLDTRVPWVPWEWVCWDSAWIPLFNYCCTNSWMPWGPFAMILPVCNPRGVLWPVSPLRPHVPPSVHTFCSLPSPHEALLTSSPVVSTLAAH